MLITLVGAGSVATALAINLIHHGHEVRLAVRPGSSRPVPDGARRVDLGPGATEGNDLVILAVPFAAAADVVRDLTLPPGTVLVDATNPFGAPVPDGHPHGLSVIAAAAGPDVAVVKAFNVLGAEHMASPVLPDGARPVLPVASDDAAARRVVVELADSLGFHAVDVGGAAAAPLLEDAARYWGLLAFAGGLGRRVVLVAQQRPDASGNTP